MSIIRLNSLILQDNKQQEKSKCVVRLTTSCYQTGSGYCLTKKLTPLKRKSEGYNILEEDIGNIGIDYVLPNILNFESAEDGIYELVTTNHSYDWESGHLDDYSYKLIEYTEME